MGLFTLPGDLAPEVYPLAWLVGRWHGEGTAGYPGIDPFAIEQLIEFAHDSGPYLSYRATTWQLDADGARREVWHGESGFWRVPPQAPGGQREPAAADDAAPPGPGPGEQAGGGPAARAIECLVADPAGFVTVYLGEVDGPRIHLASDLVARTGTSAQVEASSRMYGLVESDLLWAWDLAAFGQPLQSYMAARLTRLPVPGPEEPGQPEPGQGTIPGATP